MVIPQGLASVISLVACSVLVSAAETGNETAEGGLEGEEEEEHLEPHFSILFPWFVEILGVVVFYISTRYFKLLPYTAIMFFLGTLMGIGIHRLTQDDQLTNSIRIWESINSEVLLLVFLPGLIFHDAYTLNVHMFQVSLSQCLIMAFPMVLAGTVLVALVAFYIFPYGWSFNLAMTFGSILSATDPVAVSALLNEVGAPQRLKTHISGESLLNDGSAIVFFTIFSGLFLSELGREGVGSDIDVAGGFALFFRMSLGGACIGLAFGIGLTVLLYLLSRKLCPEENVIQVTSTITTAYLCYYTADSVAHTSGVIAVVCCGVFTKAFGATLINDTALMENYWVLTEHILNTLLFALGGTVWGTIISNESPREFNATDWGYLILLYVLLTVIRFFLVFAFYPVISRIGLKSSWQEAVFLSYGGLRGAVGISLALALDDEVFRSTDEPEYQLISTKLFGMTGGIAFLTLFINGSTAGWILKKLGLTKSSEVREKLTASYYRHFRAKILDSFIHLLSDPLFADIDFELVKDHVPYLADVTPTELKEAVFKNRDNVPAKFYHKPRLDKVLDNLIESAGTPDFDTSWVEDIETYEKERCLHLRTSFHVDNVIESVELEKLQAQHGAEPETKEERLLFLELVRCAYTRQIEKGWLNVRDGSPGFVAFALFTGIESAIDAVNRGEPLQDWENSFIVRQPWEHHGAAALRHVKKPLSKFKSKVMPQAEVAFMKLRIDLNRALAFLEAHKKALQYFEEEFCSSEITPAEKIVIKESLLQSQQAQSTVDALNKDVVKSVFAHIMCSILLNKASRMIEHYTSHGLLLEQEASERMEELEHCVERLKHCVHHHRHEYRQSMHGTNRSSFECTMHEHTKQGNFIDEEDAPEADTPEAPSD